MGKINSPVNVTLQHVFFVDSITGWCGGNDGVIIHTTDGGNNWVIQNSGVNNAIVALYFIDQQTGWAAAGFRFLYSADGGETWNEIATPDSATVFDISFPDSTHGYAVGDSGIVLRYILPVTNIESDNNSIVKEFQLFQNYPNPFNPVTHIKYSLPKTVDVELIIYNTLGERVKTLVNKNQDSAYYTVEWNGTNDSGLKVGSGVYLYSLRAGDNFNVKKMILLK